MHERKPEAERRLVSALSRGSEWNECHEASYLLSHHHLHRLSDRMKLLKFLCLPKRNRRARSKVRNEISPIESQSGAGLAVPRPTESAPDLRIGTSTLPTPSPSVPRDQESNGMYTPLSWTNHLSTPFRVTQSPTPFPIKSYLAPEVTKAAPPKPAGHTSDSKAAPESKSDWKSTAYATTKLAINLVRDSSDVFPLLKSVAGCLSAILSHCEVQFTSPRLYRP